MKRLVKRLISTLLIILATTAMVLNSWTLIPAKAASNITIGGVDIGYALGAYFTKNGKQCTCHGRKTCGEASDCNCKIVSGTCQCYGFAMWCENKLFGCNDHAYPGNFTDYGSISAGNMSASRVKALISKVPIGSHIRTGSNSYGVAHSMIITAKSDDGFTIVQANGSNNDNYSGHYNCRIGTTKYTWSSYASSTYGKRGIASVKGRGGINPTPDPEPSFTKNTKYPVPFIGYPIATSGNIPVYDGKLSQYTNHYISAGDLCTIEAVYTNGYCKVTYPTSSGTFMAYAKSSAFIASTDTPYSYKPEQNMTTYTHSDLSTTFGSVFTTDTCTVVAGGGSGKYQLIYPISSGYKIGWIKKTDVTPSQLVTPILGYNASASARTPVYQYESTLGGTKYGEIFVDDLCTLNSVNIDKNWINVTYPVSGGTKTGYVYFNQFFPSFIGKNNIYTTRVSQNTTAYQKSNMSDSIGTIYPSDSITVVGKSGSNIQVLYPITEGSNKGKYKLGWIKTSNVVKNLQRIAVTSNPSKTSYLEGESLNTSGLVITAYYDDGSTTNITGACSYSGYSNTPGTKTITAAYSGKSTAFTVVVNSKSPSTLTVTQMPSKISYYANEEFDQSGLKATVKYDNNTTADVSSEIYCTVEDSFAWPGNKSILVQYLYNSKVVVTSITVKVVGKEMTSGYDRRLPDGDYMIVSAADPSYYLDISGSATSAANGTNVALGGPSTEKLGTVDTWTITYNDGYYTICQKGSDAALDVTGGSGELGTNVQVWQRNNNSSQKWAISYFDEGKGYRIQSKCSGMSLDILGGIFSAGTNVEQYTGNSSDAQRWLFIPFEPQKTVDNGRYVLISALNPKIELDVSGDTGSVSDGTNVQIWNDGAPSRFNSFDVLYEGNGYYHLVHAASGKYLEVNGSNTDNYGNIDISSSNEANNNKWCIIPQNGGFMLVNRNSGLVMDVQDGKTDDGTNVRQHYYNGAMAQTWFFTKAEYEVKYDANGGMNAPVTQVKYYNADLTLPETAPERDGYRFLGWADGNSDMSVIAYTAGGKYTENKDTTMYAVWQSLEPDLILPSSMETIEEEAFEGGAFRYVMLPECAIAIGKRAFADCPNLKDIYIPEGMVKIAPDAFEGVNGLTIHGREGSYAEYYAQRYGFGFAKEP